MKCVICKTGETYPSRTTVPLNRGEATIVIKNVPADVCDNCGEYYLSEEMADRVLNLAEEAIRKGAEIEVLSLAA
jgi:YgiT-type zinc finger domain-containing protein